MLGHVLTEVYSTQSQPGTPTRDRHHGPPRPSHITTPSPLGGPPITPTTPVSNHRRSHSAQSPPSDGRSYLGSGARDHRRTGSSSADISINIEPPVRGLHTFFASRVSFQVLNGPRCSLGLLRTSRPAHSRTVCYRHRAPVSPCPTSLSSQRRP